MIRKLSTFIVITLMFLLCGCAKTKTTLPTVDYNITYHLDGGLNNDNPLTYNLNMGTVKLKSPEKSSCTFKGWYKD